MCLWFTVCIWIPLELSILSKIKSAALLLAVKRSSNGMDEKRKKLLIGVAVAAALGIIILIVTSIVGSSPLGGQLNNLSALETELLTLNDEAAKLEPDLATRRLMADSNALAANDKFAIESYRQKFGGKKQPSKETLASVSLNSKEKLTSAAQRDDLASTYKKLLVELTNEMAALLRESKNNTKDPQLKQVLDSMSKNVEYLRGQAKN